MSHTLQAGRASLPEAARDGWAGLRGALHAEWTKLRTVPRRPVVLATKAAIVAGNPNWQHRIERYAPMNAGLAIQSTTGLHRLPISPRGGPGVLAAWAAAALLAGGLLLRLRDA